ncbi:MAG: hypothetical protein NW214_13290 [Pseudanabaenaceae cyanobacterium bins.39]|nr:hypothetical protein [Pseudanabaenaceae cyanobacterium bins.39]
MSNNPSGGQMLWKLENGNRVLHLRHKPYEQWRPYEEFPEYALEDPVGFSKGITTFVSLLKKNWVAIKS